MPNKAETEMNEYKREYSEVCMSDEAYKAMRARMEQGKKDKKIMEKKKLNKGLFIAVAAAFALVILPNTSITVGYAMGNIPVLGSLFRVVTFREYQYEDDHQAAEADVPEITTQGDMEGDVAATAKKTSDAINAEIKNLTDKWVEEFKANMESDGYQDITIKSELVHTSKNYFTLKLICYKSAASGYEENYFYTIDLNTGERVELKDLFKDGSDYKGKISGNIKQQMREQMAADENVSYWVDDEEVPDWNFDEIMDDTAYYVNEGDEIVICFNEGDVAPMCMGAVEFVIPNDILMDIRK